MGFPEWWDIHTGNMHWLLPLSKLFSTHAETALFFSKEVP